MKNIFLFITVLQINLLFAQAPQNPISILRANDNFNFVKTDSVKKGFNTLKHILLSQNTNISFGGELREQYQYFENQNFGDVPPTFSKVSVGQLWHRIMAHANLEIGTKTRVFVQLNSTFRFFNPNPINEIDEDRLSINQAFVDYSFNKNWMMRIGRQEMGYGNNRILTFREGPNTRLSFDVAILKYKNDSRKIDILAVTPLQNNQFAFDEVSFKDYIFGVYATENFIPKKLLLDYYILNFQSNQRKYNFVAGSENRQSFGFRIFSQNPKFNYELETTYQTGTFNNQKINAYAFSSDVNYKVNAKYNLIVGVAGNYISGDKDKTDNQLNTYNLIFSKPSYGLSAPIGSSNIENINPYVRLNPTPKMSVYAGIYFMNRQSNQDGTYSPGMAEVRPTPMKLFSTNNRQIGTQYALETSYQLNQNVSFAADIAHFKAGTYVKDTGNGKDISYFSIKSTFKF